MDPLELTRALVDIDSTTGQEAAAGRLLAGFLRDRGFAVAEQPVDGERFNILATVGSPAVVLSTHFDCVPPFFPSRIEGDRLYGRGSCDAKGILSTQVAAVEALRAKGETRVGLLFVVGEERGSDGARVANGHANGSQFLVEGEPTVRLRASGRASHSSYPELGDSAIEKLIDALVLMRRLELPSDPVLGRTHYTVGLIEGGLAPNVVPPSAAAEIMFRTVGDIADVRRAIAALERYVAIDHVLDVPPVRLATVPGFETAIFPFTTDIPFLDAWGEPLLFGPGSVHSAHTADEFVSIAELRAAVQHYSAIAAALLQRCRA